MTAPAPSQGGFSLFPSPNTSRPPRNQTPRPRRSESLSRRAPTPQAISPQSSFNVSPQVPVPSVTTGRQSPANQLQSQAQVQTQTPIFDPPPRRQQQQAPPTETTSTTSPAGDAGQVPVQQPRAPADIPGRTDTAFSEANTLVIPRNGGSSSAAAYAERSSIAKLPFPDDLDAPEVPLRSIFPTYNPEVPLSRQDYLPTQKSPTRIPPAIISRQMYQTRDDADAAGSPAMSPSIRSPVRSPLRSPRSARSNGSASLWPPTRRNNSDPPALPTPSSTEQLKDYWKVANGWRASTSEGRVYCMKMTQEKDAPVYTLASAASQPFYNLRLDPTSASAYLTLSRHDPSKSYKAPKHDTHASSSSLSSGGGSGRSATEGKNWVEAISTAIEEEARKHPPNDGLVSLLMPSPAARTAVERADDPTVVAMAERECARLVWDEDSASHFLVHPALATPFCVTVERAPAWSRVEYTLEHHESPQHLAKLTRDGTGAGWLEVDTGIASKIESFYIVDVAVAALLIVAHADEKNTPAAAETFAPPPPVALRASKEGRLSRLGGKLDDRKQRRKMESFEIDLESQDSMRKPRAKVKTKEAEDEEKLPFLLRVIVKIVKGLFKVLIWGLTLLFKIVGGVFKLLYKCVGSKY